MTVFDASRLDDGSAGISHSESYFKRCAVLLNER
jgi:hypothetical protein